MHIKKDNFRADTVNFNTLLFSLKFVKGVSSFKDFTS